MSSRSAPPSQWNVDDVEAWARGIGIAPQAVTALVENEIDGPVLVTLNKHEIRAELGVQSLATRRHLWDSILKIRAMQDVSDYATAIDIHQSEIDRLEGEQSGDEQHVDHSVLETLRSDASRQRQVIEDNLLAHRMQGFTLGQQGYEDAQVAAIRQCQLDRQLIQSEYDRKYALSLAPSNRQSNQERETTGVPSLFSLCIDACVQNKLNVAEALDSGRAQVLSHWAMRFREAQNSAPSPGGGIEESKEVADDESFSGAQEEIPINDEAKLELPIIERCSVCFEEGLPGFDFPCDHYNCKNCMKALLRTALKDSSLLPLRCCEIPIDMSVVEWILKKSEADKLKARVMEMEATHKMFCPTCSQFINLDLVDTTETASYPCPYICGTQLCLSCATVDHPLITCEENKARHGGSDDVFMDLAQKEGWKQCPNCSFMIELHTGCNHMTCMVCRHQFCYQCLRQWDSTTGLCSSGRCSVWEEENLVERGEARVRAQEEARGGAYEPEERARRRDYAMEELQGHQHCDHEWRRQNLTGECERCGYDLWAYGMVCQGGCGSTVCYTCAHHRIPQRGWG